MLQHLQAKCMYVLVNGNTSHTHTSAFIFAFGYFVCFFLPNNNAVQSTALQQNQHTSRSTDFASIRSQNTNSARTTKRVLLANMGWDPLLRLQLLPLPEQLSSHPRWGAPAIGGTSPPLGQTTAGTQEVCSRPFQRLPSGCQGEAPASKAGENPATRPVCGTSTGTARVGLRLQQTINLASTLRSRATKVEEAAA